MEGLILANRETGEALLKDYVEAAKARAKAEGELKRQPLTNRLPAQTPGDRDAKDKQPLTGLDRVRAAMRAERTNKQEDQ